MIPLYRPEQVRQMDQRAFARGVDPAALMDAAALHLASGVLRAAASSGLQARYGLRVVALCGKGNNGGDGIAACRHLRRRGVDAVPVLVAPPDDLATDPAREVDSFRRAGGRVVVVRSPAELSAALARADVGVDCLLGTGAAGEPRGLYADAVQALLDLRQRGGVVVACDLPTGVDATTGRVPGIAVEADLTVTLGAHKQGLWLHPAASLVGELVLGEIGVDDGADPAVAHVLEPHDLPAVAPPPTPRDHKRSRGVVTIFAGSDRMTGAAILCARGALRGGAGLVTVASPAVAAARLAVAVPEAMSVALPDHADGIVEAVQAAAERSDVLAIGPGLGLAEDTQQAVRRLVVEARQHVVLDADGINAFRDHTDLLEAAEPRAHILVCTPHAQELGRLASTSGHGAHARRTEIARELAGRFGATLVAKGPRTVVAAPDGRVWINPTGGPSLATGGTGDVLTGLAAALVANRAKPSSVAAAVYLHGLAGDLAAAEASARSTVAGDVADHIGAAAARVGC